MNERNTVVATTTRTRPSRDGEVTSTSAPEQRRRG
jgi:hypothetical protein